MRIVPGGIVEKFRQAFGNVLTTLKAAGGVPEDLVSITIFLTDIPDYQAHGKEIGAVWRELAGPVYPAMAGIGERGCGSPRHASRSLASQSSSTIDWLYLLAESPRHGAHGCLLWCARYWLGVGAFA